MGGILTTKPTPSFGPSGYSNVEGTGTIVLDFGDLCSDPFCFVLHKQNTTINSPQKLSIKNTDYLICPSRSLLISMEQLIFTGQTEGTTKAHGGMQQWMDKVYVSNSNTESTVSALFNLARLTLRELLSSGRNRSKGRMDHFCRWRGAWIWCDASREDNLSLIHPLFVITYTV